MSFDAGLKPEGAPERFLSALCALETLEATYPAWGDGYGRGGSWQYRPIYDGYGNSLGQCWVRLSSPMRGLRPRPAFAEERAGGLMTWPMLHLC